MALAGLFWDQCGEERDGFAAFLTATHRSTLTRHMPTDDAVKAAMDTVLADAIVTGRRATMAVVERHLDLRHATVYRHFRGPITECFQPRLAALQRSGNPTPIARAD